jgi:hypothetical protein
MNHKCHLINNCNEQKGLDHECRAVISIANYPCRNSTDLNWFNLALITSFPRLRGHWCSDEYAGSFIAELYRGIPIVHVASHLIYEIALCHRIRADLQEAVQTSDSILINFKVPRLVDGEFIISELKFNLGKIVSVLRDSTPDLNIYSTQSLWN